MADHLSYEQSKKMVFRGLGLLAAITLIEVLFSLAGKGHIPGLTFLAGGGFMVYIVGFILIALSLYKAKFIIYDFMHMKYEAKGMAMTVLLPVGLLVWGIIAFFHEGNFWGERRAQIVNKNNIEAAATPAVSPIEQSPVFSAPVED
ncbi:MAG: cytochrome C oxidase subunit IV family protein [Saprospiraceae bacterium]